eukprot:1563732-Prymnesium_polylepis.1
MQRGAPSGGLPQCDARMQSSHLRSEAACAGEGALRPGARARTHPAEPQVDGAAARRLGRAKRFVRERPAYLQQQRARTARRHAARARRGTPGRAHAIAERLRFGCEEGGGELSRREPHTPAVGFRGRENPTAVRLESSRPCTSLRREPCMNIV